MPELPEVETTRRGIEPFLTDQSILAIDVRQPRLRWPVDLPHNLAGSKVTNITRRGKYILITTHVGTLIIHLGMSGSLRVVSPKTPPKLHDHIDIKLSGDHWLRFNDPRRFGSFHFQSGDAHDHWLLKNLGVEPLENEFNYNYFKEYIKGKSRTIKDILMDQRFVSGVGNIYANEILFFSQINPFKKVKLIKKKECRKIITYSKKVLLNAIKKGGSSIRDFKNVSGIEGNFQENFKVYQKEGFKCKRSNCHGIIQKKIISNRSTFFCNTCQI